MSNLATKKLKLILISIITYLFVLVLVVVLRFAFFNYFILLFIRSIILKLNMFVVATK